MYYDENCEFILKILMQNILKFLILPTFKYYF